MNSMKNNTAKKGLRSFLLGDGRISVRFRNYNIAFFALAVFFMFISMSMAINNIIWQVSTKYAGSYATSSADALSAHIEKEIALMAKAARSSAVIDWLRDEGNNEKKVLAFLELSGIVGELYGNNLYIGVGKSLNEYKIEENYTADDDVQPFDTFDTDNPEDNWYFRCVSSDKDYELSVAMDHVLQRKRVWLDYKVVHEGVTLGVICTGLQFSHIAGELFSKYNNVIRGFIVDKNGTINMDSSMYKNDDYLNYDFETRIEDELADPVFLSAVKSHLSKIDGYFEESGDPTVIKLSSGSHRYATISPIRFTDWSAVIVYDLSSSLNVSLFMPSLVIMLVLLLGFDLANNILSRRLIFLPLERLIGSLERLKENKDELIYGIERRDEFGNLSNTIMDLFTKANYDALTGLYNRRYMENNLQRVTALLSRSNGLLSVLMIDIDYFKKYNDTYGHEQGDVCLKKVAGALACSITRANDFVARYGGEEFIAVLPNTDKDGARIIAQKLLENVRLLNLPHAKSNVAEYVTVSVGVTAGVATHKQSWEDYSKRADEALYMSKQNGRNQFTYLDMTT
ncbi:MAG: GGDEF domain-containing protein [Synergistaceae bacterium]|nr:GGDEF domain-containing protein [Synergistaceae bacterium]